MATTPVGARSYSNREEEDYYYTIPSIKYRKDGKSQRKRVLEDSDAEDEDDDMEEERKEQQQYPEMSDQITPRECLVYQRQLPTHLSSAKFCNPQTRTTVYLVDLSPSQDFSSDDARSGGATSQSTEKIAPAYKFYVPNQSNVTILDGVHGLSDAIKIVGQAPNTRLAAKQVDLNRTDSNKQAGSRQEGAGQEGAKQRKFKYSISKVVTTEIEPLALNKLERRRYHARFSSCEKVIVYGAPGRILRVSFQECKRDSDKRLTWLRPNPGGQQMTQAVFSSTTVQLGGDWLNVWHAFDIQKHNVCLARKAARFLLKCMGRRERNDEDFKLFAHGGYRVFY